MTRALRIAALTLAMMALATAAQAQGPGPLKFVSSRTLGARAHDLVIREDGQRLLAYVATDLGLTIVNITDPAAPVQLGSVNVGGKTMGIAVQGSYAYLASLGTDLNIVNVDIPEAPAFVVSRRIPGDARDVAVKDNIAYVASFAGELYLFDISSPAAPLQIKSIGLPGWRPSNSGDAGNLAKLNNYVTGGSGKVTGVSVTGNSLFVVEVNYGRLYYYDLGEDPPASPANPIFKGTHFAPFLLQVQGDPDHDVVYMLSTYGGTTSGVYTVPISMLSPSVSTNYATCTSCGFFRAPATDFGGLTVSSNGKYVIYIAGKKGVVQVLDVTDPSDIKNAGFLSIPAHGMKTLETMGVQSRGDYIYTAAGTLGLQVFIYPGLSD